MLQRVVTAEEASPHIKRMLRTLLPHELDGFENLVENGAIIGRYWDTCLFATSLKACGHEIREHEDRKATFLEVQMLVRARFGIELSEHDLNPIELFVFDVRGKQTPKTNDVLAHLVVLVDEIRREHLGIRSLSGIEEAADEERALFV